MSDRLWDRTDEFTDYSPCGDNIDFIIGPDKLGRKRTAAVKRICTTCPVRPECITLNVAPITLIDPNKKLTRPSSGVWVAGVWLPDEGSAPSKRLLEKRRDELVASLPRELATRPDFL